MSKKGDKEQFTLNVKIPNENGISFTSFTFDVLLHHITKNRIYMTLGPVPVSATCQKCVFIEFDPDPLPSDESGNTAVIELFCFNANCTKAGTSPLEPKIGSRSMLLGALYALNHLAQKERRWTHLTKFAMNDESDYTCKLNPLGQDYTIRTFSTDLLTQSKTYYERHLNATFSEKRAKRAASDARKLIMSPISLSGLQFLKTLNSLITPDDPPNKEQEMWMSLQTPLLIAVFDNERSTGGTWETAFKTIQKQFGCKMYACCSKPILIYFDLLPLLGASYEVKIKNLPGFKSVLTEYVQTMNDINIILSGGGNHTVALYHKIVFNKLK